MYLLDTNHCSRLLEGNPEIIDKLSSLDDAPVMTCTIVRGELMFMAHKSERKDENLRKIEGFLRDIEILPVDEKAADFYGKMKAAIIDHYGPKERKERRKATIDKFGFSENDLWIAAVAISKDLTVVSGDSDFCRLNVVEKIRVESWISSQA